MVLPLRYDRLPQFVYPIDVLVPRLRASPAHRPQPLLVDYCLTTLARLTQTAVELEQVAKRFQDDSHVRAGLLARDSRQMAHWNLSDTRATADQLCHQLGRYHRALRAQM